MQKAEVLEQLQPLTSTTVRPVTVVPNTRVGIEDNVVVLRPGSGGKLVPFTEDGAEALGKYVGFPINTMKKLQPNTACKVMTELVQKKQRFSIFIRDGEAIAVVKTQEWHHLKAEKVLTTIERAIHLEEYNRVMPWKEHGIRIEMIGERREVVAGSAVVDDVVAGGIVLNFSPFGAFAPSIESFILRVWCTNGCVTPEVTDLFTFGGGDGGGNGDGFYKWLNSISRRAYNSVGNIAKQFSKMAAEQIGAPDRAAILESMITDAHLDDETASAVRAEAIAHPPVNSWDMMNLITWGTSHVMSDPREIVRAQNSVKGFIQETAHARTCPLCHQSRGRALPAPHEPSAN
jgi:hypothetical protein